MRVGVRHQLVRLLGRGVERQRMIDVLVHGERHLRVRAVHRAGRGVDEVLDAVVPAAFEHVREADDVAVDVGVRILQRVAHAGLRARGESRAANFSRANSACMPARSARSSLTKRKFGRCRSCASRASFSVTS